MNDVLGMGFLQRRDDLPEDFRNTLKAKRAALLDLFFEGVPFEPLHCDVGDAIRSLPGIDDVDNVFVLEPPYDPGFAIEKFEESGVANDQIWQKYLDGDLTPGAQVNGAVNSPHPAYPDERVEAILIHQRAAEEIVRVLKRQRSAVIRTETLAKRIRRFAFRTILHALSLPV
jgi:hypothetical protein